MRQAILKYKIVFFYSFTFAISWSAWFLMARVYQGGQLTPVVYLASTVGALGPLLALVILEKLSQKAISVKQILGQSRLRGAKTGWFLPAIFALPVITLVGNGGYFLLGQEAAFRLINPGPATLGVWVWPVMIVHFSVSLITSPLFEEPGWRGFALGILQARFGRNVGSLGVGLLWWLWHQPMNLTFGLEPTFYGAVSMVALSFMIDSLFNLSAHNLFTALLAHQSSGTVMLFFYQGDENWLQVTLLIGFVILLRVWERRAVQPAGARTAPFSA